MNWPAVIVGLVALQRIAEAIYAERNTKRLLDAGATETAPEQHLYFIALHSLWLAAVVIFTPANTIPNWPLLGAFVVLQALRVWVLATLGPLWTTRIISPLGIAPVRRGPYRFIKHPNYAIVAGEIAILPLAFSQVPIAITFSVLNAALLWWRIRAENGALALRTSAPSQDRATGR